jgi:glycosyltransferase involved in cell wall biosynthesis
MNILFLSAWYPTAKSPHKGIFVKEHALAIAGKGNQVKVVALDVTVGKALFGVRYSVESTSENVETHFISIESIWHKKLYALYPLLKRIAKRYIERKVLNSFQPDIIHSNVLYPIALIGEELAKSTGTPHVITEHWSKVDRFMYKNVFASRGRKAYNNAAAITCVSDFLRQGVIKHVNDVNKVKIVPNVVANEFTTSQSKPESGSVNFVAVATWTTPKRPDLFIGALIALANSQPQNICLHLFGDGPQIATIKALILPDNFQIVYRGYCGKSEIRKQLAETDFFLHASEIETFSIVVAEALCAGVPVICSNRGALPELVHSASGALTSNTPEEWAKTVQTTVVQKFNRTAIQNEYKNKYSSDAVGKAFQAIYVAVTAKP